jgi:transposase
MGDFARKADGRRIFTVEFKRSIVQQLVKGDKTLAEVSRELDIQPSVIREWKRRVEAGATTAVAATEDVVPASALREAQHRIRELERLLGRKQMEVEILQAAQEVGLADAGTANPFRLRRNYPGSRFVALAPARGARDAKPGHVPGGCYSKLLAVSRRLGRVAGFL